MRHRRVFWGGLLRSRARDIFRVRRVLAMCCPMPETVPLLPSLPSFPHSGSSDMVQEEALQVWPRVGCESGMVRPCRRTLLLRRPLGPFTALSCSHPVLPRLLRLLCLACIASCTARSPPIPQLCQSQHQQAYHSLDEWWSCAEFIFILGWDCVGHRPCVFTHAFIHFSSAKAGSGDGWCALCGKPACDMCHRAGADTGAVTHVLP